jgi:hypothetical protein
VRRPAQHLDALVASRSLVPIVSRPDSDRVHAARLTGCGYRRNAEQSTAVNAAADDVAPSSAEHA